MATEKYTVREFLNNILAGKITEADTAMAQVMLERLDAKNEKRKNTPTKAQKANAPLKEQIAAYVTAHPHTVAASVGAALEITTQKASALLRALVSDGTLTVSDTKVKGKGVVKSYTAVAASAPADGE